MRLQSLTAKAARCLAGAVALAGFIVQSQPAPLPPGTLMIELWPKSATAPRWPRLRCVNGPGQAFDLLGVVLEQVHGRNFAAVLTDALLRPFGFNQIHPYADRDWQKTLGGAERAHGYAEDGSDSYYELSHVAYLSALGPSAGMYGTAEGLARWGRLLYGEGFLSADSRAAMMRETVGSQNSVRVNGALFADAYGVATCTYKTSHGASFYGHARQALGYRVYVGHAPAINTTVAVWINRDISLDQVLSQLLRPRLEAVQETGRPGGYARAAVGPGHGGTPHRLAQRPPRDSILCWVLP